MIEELTNRGIKPEKITSITNGINNEEFIDYSINIEGYIEEATVCWIVAGSTVITGAMKPMSANQESVVNDIRDTSMAMIQLMI